MKTTLILAALAALLSPGVAVAATDIGCIETRMGPETIVRVGDRVIAAIDKGEPADSSLDADREALIAARNACRTANKWSNAAADLAISYMKARATRIGVDRALAAEGVKPADVAARYAALQQSHRRGIMYDPKMPGAAEFSILELVTGMTLAEKEKLRVTRHVAILYSSLSAIEFYPAEFAAI